MTYVVKSCETLFDIACMFHTTVEELLRLNPQITDPNCLFPGQVIHIPASPQPVPPPVHCPVLRQGSTGPAVVQLQTLLLSAGFNPGPIDGIFGPKTEAAVLAFQGSKNLVQDGIVGPLTWTALGANCTTSPPPPPSVCPTLRLGSTGATVKRLQGLLTTSGFSPGAIDGIFGPKTQAAVIAFQRSKNLVPDGIVGIMTWTALGVQCRP